MFFFFFFFLVNFVIVYIKMIICHIPWLPWSRTQANHKCKGEVSTFFTFFSDECCPECDLEKINHCVNGVAPVSIYRDWLASLFQTQSCQSCSSLMPRTSKCESHCFSCSTCTQLFQTQCSLIVLFKSDANNFKVWISLFFPSYKLLILYILLFQTQSSLV